MTSAKVSMVGMSTVSVSMCNILPTQGMPSDTAVPGVIATTVLTLLIIWLVEIDHCWAFYNGYRPTPKADNTDTFKSAGDGNGFKAGGYGMNAGTTKCPAVCPQNYIHHCVAFRNKAHGLYSNHHMGGCRWENNSSWYNRSNYNMVNRKSNEEAVDVPGYGHILKNNVSFTFTDSSKGGHLINCDASQCTIENNSFAPSETSFSVTADMFVSTAASTLFAARDAEGNLPKMDFMRAKAGSILEEKRWDGVMTPQSLQPSHSCTTTCLDITITPTIFKASASPQVIKA